MDIESLAINAFSKLSFARLDLITNFRVIEDVAIVNRLLSIVIYYNRDYSQAKK